VKGARAISGPGEYEIGGVFITAVPTRHKGEKNGTGKNTIYVFDYDGLTVCHMGDLDHLPSQSHIEALGTVNVALIPVGGGGGLNASTAAEVISLIEPSIVIPMHYKTLQTNLKLDSLSKFLKEMGLSKATTEDSAKFTRGSLPEETQVVVLNVKGA